MVVKILSSAIALVLSLAAGAHAAPPTVTYLFPAGAQRGTTAEITAGGTFGRWPVQVWVSDRGIDVQPGKDKGKLTVTVAADVVPGTYWLRLYDEQGASAPRPFIVGTVPEVREQEPNDEPKQPQRIDSLPVNVNGRLEKTGDVDGFALQLNKGQTLVAALEAHTNLRSPMDAILQVVSADGFVLEQNNDFHGLDPFIAYAVPKDGTYIVRTFAFPATPDSSIRFAGGESYVYRLTLTTGGYADHTSPLAVSRADPGAVELFGWNLPDEAKKLPATIAEGANEATVSHPAVANAVNVAVEDHACLVRPAANDAASEPFAIELPVTVTGHLTRARVADAYAFTAKKGQKLLFRAESPSLGLAVSPALTVTDGAMKTLASVEPTGIDSDTELTFTTPADGSYRLVVRDRYRQGGPRHVYRLRATPAEPDFTLAVKSDRFTLTAGQSLAVPVTVQRLQGFSGDIELTVEGLPPGVEAMPPESAKNAQQLTLKLSTKADVQAASAPIRIVGKAKAGPDRTRAAVAPVAEPGEGNSPVRTPLLWLTVTRPPEKKPSPPDGPAKSDKGG